MFERINAADQQFKEAYQKRSKNISKFEDENIVWVSEQRLLYRSKRDFLDYPRAELEAETAVPLFNDELWNKQWYMVNKKKLGCRIV